MSKAGDFRIRPGTAADVDAMFRLDIECFDEVFRFSRAAMGRFALGRNRHTLIADGPDQTIAGFVIVSVHPGYGVGYVVTLDVATAFRRLGLARQLMLSAEALLTARGVRSVELHVHVGNGAARALYERLGYEAVATDAGFYGPGLDALSLRKRLRREAARSDPAPGCL